jgi:DNA gyrase inhibitor GyrI
MLQKANHASNQINQSIQSIQTIDVVMVTHECLERDFTQAFEQFKTHALIKQAQFIRVMYL